MGLVGSKCRFTSKFDVRKLPTSALPGPKLPRGALGRSGTARPSRRYSTGKPDTDDKINSLFSPAYSQTQFGGSDDFKSLVAGDKIYSITSITLAVIGGTLFSFPSLFSGGSPAGAFLAQQWSLFFLSCGFLAFFAPTLESKSKRLIGTTFKYLFAVETLLAIGQCFKDLRSLNFFGFLSDILGAILFMTLCAGYLVNDDGDT